MTASPLLRLIVLSLCALLVVSQAPGALEFGDSDLTDIDGTSHGFLGLLNRARPQYLKLLQGQGPSSKRAEMNSAAKRRSKNAKCMADFWKGRGLVDC